MPKSSQKPTSVLKSIPLKKPLESVEPAEDTGRAAFQIRIPREVHAKLTAAAADLDVSLNAVVEDILDACSRSMYKGDAVKESNGAVSCRKSLGMLWFGKAPNYYFPDQDDEMLDNVFGDTWDGNLKNLPAGAKLTYPGTVWFRLKLNGSPVLPGDD